MQLNEQDNNGSSQLVDLGCCCLPGHVLSRVRRRSSPACVVSLVTGWLHGDGRLLAALVTLHGTSPTWPTSGPPCTHLEGRGIEAAGDLTC